MQHDKKIKKTIAEIQETEGHKELMLHGAKFSKLVLYLDELDGYADQEEDQRGGCAEAPPKED